jgi:pimeloyl-ACP methyl ester carboxylesterase
MGRKFWLVLPWAHGWRFYLRANCGAGNRRMARSPAALVLIAPAVDFTEELMWKRFPAPVKRKLESEGIWERPSQYSSEPYPITAGLIEDGRRHLLLGGLIETGCPVRILQGVADPDVPWRHAVELVSRLAQDDVVLSLIKDGDHACRDRDIRATHRRCFGVLQRREQLRHMPGPGCGKAADGAAGGTRFYVD